MKLWKKIALGVLAVVMVAAASGYGYFRYQNIPPQLKEPNYYTYFQQQDTVPVGKVGVLI